jgi:mono/diheme cytochrome c family protein
MIKFGWAAAVAVLGSLFNSSLSGAETTSFRRDILPILANSCVKCHSGDEPKGGLNLTTRAGLLRGGDSGQAVVSGKSDQSLLIKLVRGEDPDRVMPAQGPRLTDQQLKHLQRWIDQQLAWKPGVTIVGLRQAPLEPRLPAIPPLVAGKSNHPIDRILQPYYESHGQRQFKIVSDRVFARRVYLDLLGLIPTPDQIQSFLADQQPNKRARLVDKLLASKRPYAEHWLTFWNDILRNAYQGTGYIDGGRKPITNWLYRALYSNKSYDQFVRELLSPTPESEGFIRGIIWRGVVNASQTREMQAAQNVSQVFMGTNLKCASCHNSFINHWTLEDSYGLAAIFANGPLEIHRCNKMTGKMAKVKFLYPQLGSIDAKAPRAVRLKQLANLVTSDKNGRFTRTISNRLWAWLLGRGIVEPLDDMDQLPWNQDLLDFLASDLQQHGYDLKHTLALICTSQAYQLPSVGAPAPNETTFVFRGPLVKRMTAEQFVDAVNTLTHAWPSRPAIKLPVLSNPELTNSATHAIKAQGHWIWDHAQAAQSDSGGSVFFRKPFTLKTVPAQAIIAVACDNEFILYVNGKRVGKGAEWGTPLTVDIREQLKVGDNLIAVHGINWPDKLTGKGLNIKGANPAGLLATVALGYAKTKPPAADASKPADTSLTWQEFSTDASWHCSRTRTAKWFIAATRLEGWKPAAVLGNQHLAPWQLANRIATAMRQEAQSPSATGQVRTALVNDDVLTRALGRPNREQVVTRRSSHATTLQAIELTNGESLDTALKRGASHWLSQEQGKVERLIEQLYEHSLSRKPTDQEQKIAAALIQTEDVKQGIEDLLWILTMLPEFQLIY